MKRVLVVFLMLTMIAAYVLGIASTWYLFAHKEPQFALATIGLMAMGLPTIIAGYNIVK